MAYYMQTNLPLPEIFFTVQKSTDRKRSITTKSVMKLSLKKPHNIYVKTAADLNHKWKNVTYGCLKQKIIPLTEAISKIITINQIMTIHYFSTIINRNNSHIIRTFVHICSFVQCRKIISLTN